MRGLLFIISISALLSCNVKYKTIKYKNVVDMKETISESEINDTLLLINNDIQIIAQDTIIFLNNQMVNLPEVIAIASNPDKKKSPNVEIIITDDTDTLNKTKGIIAYSIPIEMVVGQKYRIKVRITKDREGKDILVVGDRNIPINDVSVDSKIRIEDIRVEKVMISELMYDESSFLVSELSSKVQNIEDK